MIHLSERFKTSYNAYLNENSLSLFRQTDNNSGSVKKLEFGYLVDEKFVCSLDKEFGEPFIYMDSDNVERIIY